MRLPPSDLYSEPFPDWLRRHVLGLAFLLRPRRIVESCHLALAMGYRQLVPGPRIPDEASILSRPAGFVDVVRDTSVEALLEGMCRGFHPHGHIGQLKWWALPERAVVMLDEVHLEREFRRKLRRSTFHVTFDRAFDEVMLGCAARRPGQPWLTWLHPAVRQRMRALHDAGYAHSVEAWNESGDLVGGLFGVALGPVFCNLSMFHTETHASKVAVYSLLHHLDAWGMLAFDNQGLRPWVARAGGKVIARRDFVELLRQPAPPCAGPGRWNACFSLAQTADFKLRSCPHPHQAILAPNLITVHGDAPLQK